MLARPGEQVDAKDLLARPRVAGAVAARRSPSGIARINRLAKPIFQPSWRASGRTSRRRARRLARRLATALEDHQRRDAADAVSAPRSRRRLGVELREARGGFDAAAACSNTGAIARQGPHHGAQKSTTTGTSGARRRADRSCRPSGSTGSPSNSGSWHLGQRGASRDALGGHPDEAVATCADELDRTGHRGSAG